MSDYTCYCMSNRPELFKELEKSMHPEKVRYFDGNDYPSYAALLNKCVSECPTERIIILSDKARPTALDIQKMLLLLDSGYAFVGLSLIRMMGFDKELMRQIGMFDERFIGGGYDDFDFVLRVREANYAMYFTDEVEVIELPTTWNYARGGEHFKAKWNLVQDTNPYLGDPLQGYRLVKTLEEETYYNLGPSVPKKFLPFDYSTCPSPSQIDFLAYNGLYLHFLYPELMFYYSPFFKYVLKYNG